MTDNGIEIKPDTRNPNKGTERGLHMVRASFERTGPGRSSVIDADGNVIVGNHALEVAMELGLTPRIIDLDPSEFVLLRRADLHLDDPEDTRAREMSIADNRSAQQNINLDVMMIDEFQQQGVETGPYWFPEEFAFERERYKRDHASDFLDPFLAPEGSGAEASGSGGGGSGSSPDAPEPANDGSFVQLNFTFTVDQRRIVLDAIARAKDALDVTTSMEAIVAICEAYTA
jgi:hypothetical protein